MALFRFTPKLPTPPGVGASCLRKKYTRHTCKACADACPVKAITFSGVSVSINETDCIHCGRCLFSCPSGSLLNLQAPLRTYRADTLVAPFSALAPDTDELLMWHHEYGIRRAALDIDENSAWALAIAALNIRLRKLNEPVWEIIPPDTSSVNRFRRHLMQVANDEVKSGRATADRRERRRGFRRYSEYALSLSTARCTVCGACARVCREQALSFSENALEWSSTRCTGCGTCAAVCIPKAITIEPQIQQSYTERIPLIPKTCTCCQHLFNTVNAEQACCHICLRHQHNMREA